MKKKIIIFSMSLMALALFLRAVPPPTPEEELLESYGRQPPLVKNIWVQKLASPTETQTMILQIEYEDNVPLPETMKLYYGEGDAEGNGYITFYDNGSGPDPTPNDRIFSAYLGDDPTAFSDKLVEMQNTLSTKGKFIHFSGHLGELITGTALPLFDASRFADHLPTTINARLLDAVKICEIRKENSLFITDLPVVEDDGRTFNIVDTTGTPMGDWTFGHFISNIANETGTTIRPQEMLKRWLRGWVNGRSINGQPVPSRQGVIEHCIAPWMKRAKASVNMSSVTAANWETTWDSISQDSLLTFAPFRLMAIVNRLDLRANFAYGRSINGLPMATGETRFIFTLIAPFNTIEPVTLAGMPPKGHPDSKCGTYLDWSGMNVILEYANPPGDRCQLKSFAQQWANLSYLDLGSEEYKNALAAIIHTITDANAIPGRPNGSALNQIRTNERIFAPSGCPIFATSDWMNSDWELSQFELDKNTGYLVPAPVSNTPANSCNLAYNLSGGTLPGGTVTDSALRLPTGGMTALLDWVFWKKINVNRGVHTLPLMYTYAGDTMRLAATARVDGEQLHYWDFNWEHPGTTHYTNITGSPGTSYVYEKQMRQQLSLNTCQGCHAGENKTLFTQMRPLGYGQAARYWDANPKDDTGNVDARFVSTYGASMVNFVNESVNPLSSKRAPRVSAFLTGRSTRGATTDTTDWQDDWHNFADDADDATMNGLYYVYDPSNRYEVSTDMSRPRPDRVNGYNDLEMRKQHLCDLVDKPCDPGLITLPGIFVLREATHPPFSKD